MALLTSVVMSSSSSNPTTSTTQQGKRSWKKRFSFGTKPSKGEDLEQTLQRANLDDAEAPINGTGGGDGGPRKSVKNLKKKMSGRFRELLTRRNSRGDGGNVDNGSAGGGGGGNGSPSNPQSPHTSDQQLEVKSKLYEWQDEMERKRALEIARQKQFQKERDGFCRRVDTYDGQVITVDGKPSYELGNYLGGGVAGVVYEGNRLLMPEEYPIRTGSTRPPLPTVHTITTTNNTTTHGETRVSSFLCLPDANEVLDHDRSALSQISLGPRANSLAAEKRDEQPVVVDQPSPQRMQTIMAMEGVAIETTGTYGMEGEVLVDRADAPSRSRVAARAAATTSNWFLEETVAIKILNPVGFRILTKEQLKGAVVVKEGEPMSRAVRDGKSPMADIHVWWLVNPSSRNLQTLQRYNLKNANISSPDKRIRDIDRGSPERGLRLSLVAAFKDERGNLRELPLTRCIEIWGHIPFGATDSEFDEMMDAIERVNAGQAPKSASDFTSMNNPGHNGDGSSLLEGADGSTVSYQSADFQSKRVQTGLYKAATRSRKTVFCDSLNAYIALPEVPPKYLRWLRQRRAATKEIRNMMLIGRHRNVVHLYEVLEYIQDSKSTMFLILELVRGGELFDLISSSSPSDRHGDGASTEEAMKKFFRELASGIHYCHMNGIAHRDLKPENLLVHNHENGDSTLKIADFGLSATFGVSDEDQRSLAESSMYTTPLPSPMASPVRTNNSVAAPSPAKPTHDENHTSNGTVTADSSTLTNVMFNISTQALQMLTCGAVEEVQWCGPTGGLMNDGVSASPLRRMTSVVGSPHYVAPEIISQTDDKRKSRGRKNGESDGGKEVGGYDGTKADVWSAGVILYAMLFRSLPFGEDLLRCPRFQSFRKWYSEASEVPGGRRSSAMAALNPVITEADEADQLGPHWFFPSETTKESRDMIVAMLNPNPAERLSIELVLQHPWLRMSYDQ